MIEITSIAGATTVQPQIAFTRWHLLLECVSIVKVNVATVEQCTILVDFQSNVWMDQTCVHVVETIGFSKHVSQLIQEICALKKHEEVYMNLCFETVIEIFKIHTHCFRHTIE